MESWNREMSTNYGSECEPHEDTREDIVDKKALKQSTVSHMRLGSVDIMSQWFASERIHSKSINKDRFGMDNIISSALAKSMGCLVIKAKGKVNINQGNTRTTHVVTGATTMWVRLSNQGHNENDEPVAFIQIVLAVASSLDSSRFQLILNRATMEELKMIPPSRNRSPQETKDARRLRKLKKNITRRQEVHRIRRLHKHDECRREQQFRSNNIFHAASVGQINQPHFP